MNKKTKSNLSLPLKKWSKWILTFYLVMSYFCIGTEHQPKFCGFIQLTTYHLDRSFASMLDIYHKITLSFINSVPSQDLFTCSNHLHSPLLSIICIWVKKLSENITIYISNFDCFSCIFVFNVYSLTLVSLFSCKALALPFLKSPSPIHTFWQNQGHSSEVGNIYSR